MPVLLRPDDVTIGRQQWGVLVDWLFELWRDKRRLEAEIAQLRAQTNATN